MIGSPRVLRRAALLLLLAACAQVEPPSGGPEDRTPPYLVMQEPDTLAVVPGWDQPVVIRFSERISEQEVEQSVMVSPRTSPVIVDRGSRGVEVSMRRGWESGTIYHVTVRPLIQDLFNNRLTERVRIVFSTGPEIPDTRLSGVVRDRITGEPAVDARVEAIRTTDSLVYAVPSDSLGQFELEYVPEGEYLVRAYPDQNVNRTLDALEPRDSLLASITTADTASVELSIVLPDSTPPVIASAAVAGERRVDVRFDDYLDPAQELAPGAVVITGPDGTQVPIDTVTIGEPPVVEDTVAEAPLAPGADTTAAPPAATDTTAAPEAAADTVAAPEAAADTVTAPAPAADTTGAAVDAAQAEPILPSQLLVVVLEEGVQLTPEAEYTVTVTDIRNVVGLNGGAEAQFTAPEPPPPAPEQEADTVPQTDPALDAEPDPEPELMIP